MARIAETLIYFKPKGVMSRGNTASINNTQ